MKFLISTNVQKFRSLLGDNSPGILYCQHTSALPLRLSSPDEIQIWICQGDEVTEALMEQWLSRSRHSPKTLLVHDAKFIPALQKLSRGRVAAIQATPKPEKSDSSWAWSTLRAGEILHTRSYVVNAAAAAACRPKEVAPHNNHAKKTVVIVGAGIMGLVMAEFLAIRGFRVHVVDSGPDPRTLYKDPGCLLGATHAGSNARMFTVTEADCYNDGGSSVYRNMRHIFRKTAREGGWSVKPPSSFSAADLAWINAFEQLPTWLARAMKEDIHHVNQVSGKLWADFMDRVPELFEGVDMHKDILRLYAEESALHAAAEVYRELGEIEQEFSLPAFLQAHTTFHAAAESNDLAGGFVVKGFTLGIHSFVNRLLDRIVALDGKFTWNCCVTRIRRNASSAVTMLESDRGPLQADNFVISTGVTRNRLLDGTASANLVQGVLGIWLHIPNLDPQLDRSAKIHRRGFLVEDINVTVSTDAETGEDILIFGGGYGYVGLDSPSPDSPELRALFDELEEVARIYFPAGYQRAKEQGTLWPGGERKFCIRPFTCTGLGIFEDIPTASGGHLVITGGNNTGGFAQAPAIARAVCRAMSGEPDPIHVLFHPQRSQLVSQVQDHTQHAIRSNI